LLLCAAAPPGSEFALSNIFGDVLQRGNATVVWGFATAEQQYTRPFLCIVYMHHLSQIKEKGL